MQSKCETLGLTTHSSGNHGQAVAWAAKHVAKVPCVVVVPEGTPEVKCKAIGSYGAELVFSEPNPTSRKETCLRIARERNLTVIHPDDNEDVIKGQGTIALEFHEQVKGDLN